GPFDVAELAGHPAAGERAAGARLLADRAGRPVSAGAVGRATAAHPVALVRPGETATAGTTANADGVTAGAHVDRQHFADRRTVTGDTNLAEVPVAIGAENLEGATLGLLHLLGRNRVDTGFHGRGAMHARRPVAEHRAGAGRDDGHGADDTLV